MRKTITAFIKPISIALLSLFVLAACGKDDHQKPIKILYPSWSESVALMYLADEALTQNGFEVEKSLVEPGPLFAAVAQGSADLYLTSWLPNTHRDYWERFGDQLDIVSVIFDGGVSGLAVPQYVNINTIEELNDHVEMFDGKIYGDGAGAGIHALTLQAITDYELQYEQIGSSEASMLAELRRAIKAEEPVIITSWKPHYMWDLYELKMLDDPKVVYPTDEITILSRKGFSDDQPEVTHFLKNFKLDSQKLHELIGMARKDERHPEVGVKEFYQKYKTEIDSWFQ